MKRAVEHKSETRNQSTHTAMPGYFTRTSQ